jgi:hypothetical protein
VLLLLLTLVVLWLLFIRGPSSSRIDAVVFIADRHNGNRTEWHDRLNQNTTAVNLQLSLIDHHPDHSLEQGSSLSANTMSTNPITHHDQSLDQEASSATRTPPRTTLRDIHIVMIGDSLMRYQYLSLAYRLRYGVWFDTFQRYYNLVNERTFQNPFHKHTWGEFLFQTNRILQPNEVCDCWRQPNTPKGQIHVIENRYYYDPVFNNSVVYLRAMGHWHPMEGRLAPAQVRKQTRDWQMRAMNDYLNLTWQYKDWSNAIRHYVRHLRPQPRHIIMNAGFWRHKFGWVHLKKSAPSPNDHESKEHWILSKDTESMLQLIEKTPQYHYAWKTTTYLKDQSATSLENDILMCDRISTCFNMSFTRGVRQNLYWDNKHFYEPVYRVTNEVMLDQLGYLPKDYVRMNISEILE